MAVSFGARSIARRSFLPPIAAEFSVRTTAGPDYVISAPWAPENRRTRLL